MRARPLPLPFQAGALRVAVAGMVTVVYCGTTTACAPVV
jgi:hypothetical protein